MIVGITIALLLACAVLYVVEMELTLIAWPFAVAMHVVGLCVAGWIGWLARGGL